MQINTSCIIYLYFDNILLKTQVDLYDCKRTVVAKFVASIYALFQYIVQSILVLSIIVIIIIIVTLNIIIFMVVVMMMMVMVVMVVMMVVVIILIAIFTW